LSKQLTTLEEAGYVHIRKGFVGKRPRTSARLTPAGRAAFEQHVAALQEIVSRSGATILPRLINNVDHSAPPSATAARPHLALRAKLRYTHDPSR
jgi:DNA-binding MarR family transcriptional regulator